MRKVTRIWGPRCKRGRYWMEGRRTFWDLQVFVTGPENWDAILMNRKELIHSRDWGEMQMSGHGWRWNATWMAVRCNYRGLGGGETRCGWRWYSYLDLYGDEMEPEWKLATHGYSWLEGICYLDGDEMRISASGWRRDATWRWDVNSWTLPEVRKYMDGVETKILWSAVNTGLGNWDGCKARITFWVALR